jgi:hypothetical protein
MNAISTSTVLPNDYIKIMSVNGYFTNYHISKGKTHIDYTNSYCTVKTSKTTMNESIKINGHSGTHTVTAVKIADALYSLRLVQDFYRFGGFAEDPIGVEGLSFIDPSGGPLIAQGSIAREYHPDLPNLRIKKLESRMDEGLTMHLESIDDDLDEPLGEACKLDDPECESCQ